MSVSLIETPRLRLTTWGPEGADEVHALHADPEVNLHLFSYGHDWTREDAESKVNGWMREHREHGLGKHRIGLRDNGDFVGRAGFGAGQDGVPEISYSLARAHWGKGYAFEIAAALRDWFFATRSHDRFIGFAHMDNAASQRVLEKIGMRRTHQGAIGDMPHQFFELTRDA